MKSYWVYILKCNDNTYYTGITNDLDRRFVEHSSGLIKTCYTYARRPIHIVFYQVFSDVNQAIMFEKKIKKWSKAKKEALINNNLGNYIPFYIKPLIDYGRFFIYCQ